MKSILMLSALLAALPAAYAAPSGGPDRRAAAAAPDPSYENGLKAIQAKDWNVALEHLGRAVARDPGNADIHNYLGYAHRNAGNLDAAFKSYAEALRLDPRHKAAHEYVGEAYLKVNNLAKAEEHLALLDRICFLPCEEYRDLKKEIEAYKKKNGSQ